MKGENTLVARVRWWGDNMPSINVFPMMPVAGNVHCAGSTAADAAVAGRRHRVKPPSFARGGRTIPGGTGSADFHLWR